MDLTDLDGVGPARSESLAEAGYASVEAVAEADPDVLADDADVPDDTALDFVVQAQNLVEGDASEDAEDDAEESEESDGPLPGELAQEDSVDTDADESEDEAEAEESDEVEEEPVYELTVNLRTDTHYDAYMTALLNAYERRSGSHQPTLDAIATVLDDARYNNGEVTHELTAFELNSMHAAVSQQVTDYKGQNMIDHMDAMRDLLEQVNEVREEELF